MTQDSPGISEKSFPAYALRSTFYHDSEDALSTSPSGTVAKPRSIGHSMKQRVIKAARKHSNYRVCGRLIPTSTVHGKGFWVLGFGIEAFHQRAWSRRQSTI